MKLSQKINELVLTFCYCGKARKAPGTFGTIGGVIFWFYIHNFFIDQQYPQYFEKIFWAIFIISIMIYTHFAIPKYYIFNQNNNRDNSRGIDHSSIVIDEVVGIIIALEIFNIVAKEMFILSQEKFLIYVFLCFCLFRFFDIKKPSIIGVCDRKIKNAFGVMLDDIICGIFAGIITLVLYLCSFDSPIFKLINC
jgi:phosphatidylglycerophosphatase A